jgi:type II secretory ATPase GspE/PulE/Tfp pilus assembly ATPase PilB-like protein
MDHEHTETQCIDMRQSDKPVALDADTGFFDLSRFELDPERIRRLSEDFCRKHQVVLLGRSSKTPDAVVPLGMLDMGDEKAVHNVESRHGCKVRRIQLNADEFDLAFETGFGGDGYVASGPLSVRTEARRIELKHHCEISFTRDQTPAGMVRDTLVTAVRLRASDVHFEVYANDVDVRYRIDGVLQQCPTPISRKNICSVISFLKVLAELDISERRIAQDGRFGAVYADGHGHRRNVDFRVAVLPGRFGEELVLRVLDEQRMRIGLRELGMSDDVYNTFLELLHSPGGTILVTGPTGSGKTTTLYAAIQEINSDMNKVLTVEDPVEFEIKKVNQKQVDSKMSFADYARSFMRQDPDVMMLGEVRDKETAAIALRAAQTGRMVLTTIHSLNAKTSVGYLLALAADRQLVASTLLGVLSQRLLRRLCTECREPCIADPALTQRLPEQPLAATFFRAVGCRACNGTGDAGQIGIYELLRFDDTLRDVVVRQGSLTSGQLPTFRTLVEDAMDKAAQGITSLEEVARQVPM